MPQIKMPNGDIVQFPDDMPKDQIQSMINKKFPNAGNTIGGDLARGLGHGLASSLGMSNLVGDEPTGKDESWARWGGERVGSAAPAVGAAVASAYPPVRAAIGTLGPGVIGATTGALQPAKDWKERAENMALGAGGAYGGGLLNKVPGPVKTALDRLAEWGMTTQLGSHLGFGSIPSAVGSAAIAHYMGPEAEKLMGGYGPYSLMSLILSNPTIAAYLAAQSRPQVNQAAGAVKQGLSQPSQ